MLKITFKTLAVLLAALLLTAALYVWRSLPKLDGEMRVPGLEQNVTLRRDGADVTHIQAATPQDAWFALGYVHAQERAWQLAFNRRVMHGTLSEVLGPATLETDRLLRTLDIMGVAEAQYRNLPESAREPLQRYSDGINAFFKHSPQALPPEFWLVGGRPGGDQPAWTPQDSVGWALI
jgi:penicillin amidase